MANSKKGPVLKSELSSAVSCLPISRRLPTSPPVGRVRYASNGFLCIYLSISIYVYMYIYICICVYTYLLIIPPKT